MSDITLSGAVRTNLLSLQKNQSLIDRTQSRLSTGLEVASPIDNAVAYFQAKSLTDRAEDLGDRKSAMEQGVKTLETALSASNAIEKLVSQMKGVVDSARSGDQTQRAEYTKQLQELSKQIERLVEDSSYQGLNLLNSSASKLSVRFSEKSEAKLNVDGVDFQSSAFFLDSGGNKCASIMATTDAIVSSGLGFGLLLSAFNFDNAEQLASFNSMADLAVSRLDKVISNVRSKASNLASNVNILNIRTDFTKEYVSTLESGASKLTVADLNSEGANLLALQTRQQMGIQTLSFAGQSEQSILSLLR